MSPCSLEKLYRASLRAMLLIFILSLAAKAGAMDQAGLSPKSAGNREGPLSGELNLQPVIKKPQSDLPLKTAVLGTATEKAGDKSYLQGASFDEGWRWLYRKKAIENLKRELDAEDTGTEEVLGAELGLGAGLERHDLIGRAGVIVKNLEKQGQVRKAELLKNILLFFEDDKHTTELETALRTNPTMGFNRLGWFLLGDYYDKKGFYPEASGFYSRIMNDKEDSFIRSATVFRRARLLFFEGKFNESKEGFKNAVKAGIKDSGLWLASAYLSKGEYGSAWEIFSKYMDRDIESIDSVTLLNLADMYMIRKNYPASRRILELLRSRNRGSEFLEVFFSIRIADSYLAEGHKENGVKIYEELTKKIKGEDRGMAELALVELLVASSDDRSLQMAEKLYKSVADEKYLGSDIMCIRLISTQIKLGKFDDALKNIEGFPFKYPVSSLRPHLSQLKSQLVYAWIDSLYKKDDYSGVIRVFSAHGSSILFGKKGDTFLKVGRSFYNLGFESNAAGYLDYAAKVGTAPIARDAMLTLAHVYLDQRDTSGAERLIRALNTGDIDKKYGPETQKMLLRSAYIKGDYKKVADSKPYDDAEMLIMNGSSCFKIGRFKDAQSAYEKALVLFKKTGDAKRLGEAYMGAADSGFNAGQYQKAVDYYRKAIELTQDKSESKSWALYQIARSFSRLNRKDESEEAARELKGASREFGNWAAPVLKDLDLGAL